jgi:hypothetical protein
MAAKSKAQTEPQAQRNERPVKCSDDHFRVAGGQLKAAPLAINPEAGSLELAIGTQTRVHRLVKVIQGHSTSDMRDRNTFDVLAGYAEEIVALADATVDRLQSGARHG